MDNLSGYYWAYENADEVDADWLFVFVELDQSVWYGKCEFKMGDFMLFIKIDIDATKPKHVPQRDRLIPGVFDAIDLNIIDSVWRNMNG